MLAFHKLVKNVRPTVRYFLAVDLLFMTAADFLCAFMGSVDI